MSDKKTLKFMLQHGRKADQQYALEKLSNAQYHQTLADHGWERNAEAGYVEEPEYHGVEGISYVPSGTSMADHYFLVNNKRWMHWNGEHAEVMGSGNNHESLHHYLMYLKHGGSHGPDYG